MKKNNICKKLFVANILIIYIMCFILTPINDIFAYEISEYKNGINAFPDSYKEALNNLKKAHPNWNFVAVYTNLDYDYVVDEELKGGRSLISNSSFSDEWKNGSSNEPGWSYASKKAVSYFLDPRNFLNEEKIFQFESSKFNKEAHTADVIESVLSGYQLANKTYYINNNKKVDMGKRFSDVIYDAAKENNVSAVHLASRIIQETGGTIGSIKNGGSVLLDQNGNVAYYNSNGAIKTASRTLNGSYGDFKGYYNFFNIGAFCTTAKCGNCGNPFIHGLEKAKESGWTTPSIAISAAAKYLNDNWIKYGQDTVYFEKFDVNFVKGAVFLFGNQYMTNISAASTEASLMYKGYKNSNKLDCNFTFYIPVYDNMPNFSSSSTSTSEKKVQVINCEGAYLNLRSGAGTNYSSIAHLANGTVMTQIEDVVNGWIKVKLSDGTQGYVSKEYIKVIEEIKNIDVTSITLAKSSYSLTEGSKITIEPNILPSDATDKSYTITSSNEKIVKINGKSLVGVGVGKANVTYKTTNGKEVTVSIEVTNKQEQYSINTNNLSVTDDNYIIGMNAGTKLSKIIENITLTSGLKTESKNVDNKTLNNDSLIGTGTIIKILDSSNKEIVKYTIIIRGDVNGDGKITSSDYVLIKNHIMGTSKLSDIKKRGADVNKDGKVSSSDYVLIKNHIMGYSTIKN